MNLTKIEAYGFKSFADKFEMKFEKPITAIVGPNGCGKSNVSDAVRWVLGEQSARNMRGKAMQDLIFNGTEKRKSMSYCEVSLFFDNKDRLFSLDMDEVVISRKLYRSGESEYLINKNPTLLKVIADLLREVGLGLDGYSIVGQGRLDNILNAKPIDRRSIFEEALGISKFRIRKRSTEKKLEKYRDNMSRLNDIMTELDNQLTPLKKQSEVAKKFLDLNSQLKNYEVNSYIFHYDNASVDKLKISDKISAYEEEQNLAEMRLNAANDKYQELYAKMADTDEAISRLHNEELNLTVEVERQSGENKLLTEQIKYFNKTVEDCNADIEFDKNAINSTAQKISEQSDELEQKTKNHAQLVEKLGELNLRHLEAEEKVNSMRDSSEATQSRRMELFDALTDQKAAMASLISEKNSLSTRLTDIDEQEKEITQRLSETSEEEKRVVTVFENAKTDSDSLKLELDRIMTQNTVNEQKLFDTTAAFNNLSQSLAVLKARQKYLVAATENFEGFVASVKQLMKDAQSNLSLSSKALGVVANLIKVDKKYEVAIDAALGFGLQNVVTKNEEDTKFLLGYLKQKHYGRVTFMPLTSIKPRTIDDRRVLNEIGCIGIAEEVVETEPAYKKVVNNLLGSTVLVDNIDNATKISKKYLYSYRIVTLEGDIIVPAGTFTGGGKRAESSLLGNERELDELKQKINKAEAELKETSDNKLALSSSKQRFALAVARLNAEYQQAIVKVAAYQERISKFGSLNDNERNFFKRITEERNSITQKLDEINKKLVTVDNLISDLNARQTQISSANDDVQKEYVTLKAKRNAIFDDINDIKLKISLLANNISTQTREIATLKDNLSTLKFDLSEKTQKLNTAQLNLSDLREKLINSSHDSTKAAALNRIKQQNLDMVAQKDNLRSECTKADEARNDANAEVSRIYECKLKAENELSNIDISLEALQKRMDEVYQISYSQALMLKTDDFDPKTSEVEINKLKNAISRLGYVNPNSIEDYENTRLRYDDMDSQMQDLKKAEADQLKIIQDLTKEMVERFNNGFGVISRNFSEIFRELFAGGHARLAIEEDENLSALDYGIEIEAQPPGKRVQNISALSGGERALVSVAILLAIIKFRPMPFCVLDEIEAPLDDANIERVAKYLRYFSEKTQFLIITHKKPTMEASDVLYGVTMEEKGVSKTVAVQLSEAIANIETA